MKYSTLSVLLKTRIRYHGVRDVAKHSKISPATVSRVSRGYIPDLATYFKLCKYFDVDAPFSIGFRNKRKTKK